MTNDTDDTTDRDSILNQLARAVLGTPGDPVESIGDGTPIGAGSIDTRTVYLSTDQFEEIRIAHNDREFVVRAAGDDLVLEERNESD